MKYCTKCATEYRDDIISCADCGGALIGPSEWDAFCRARDHEAAEEFVPVQTLHDSFAADVMRNALETEGIPVLVRSFSDTSFDGLYIPQKGWGLILVPKEFCDRAQQIISALEQSPPPQSDL